jgi:hypothetical protein
MNSKKLVRQDTSILIRKIDRGKKTQSEASWQNGGHSQRKRGRTEIFNFFSVQ